MIGHLIIEIMSVSRCQVLGQEADLYMFVGSHQKGKRACEELRNFEGSTKLSRQTLHCIVG